MKLELKMDKQKARQLYELADRLSKLDVNTLSEEQLSHRNTMIAKLQEEAQGVKEEFNGEYDDEAGMVQSNLRTMARAVNGLLVTIEDNDNLPEWAQEKIAKAEMMTTSVWDYLLSQKEQGIDPKVSEDVTEGNDHSLKKVWDRYSKHLMASRGDHPSVTQIHKSGEITRNIRKYVRDHHGQKAVDDMERYAEKRQWSEGIAEAKKPSPKLTPVNIKKTEAMSEEINNEAYERLHKVFAFKNYES